jgi:hypothetical protein
MTRGCAEGASPKAVLLPQVGPSLSFPVAGFWRDATTASLPGTGGTDDNTAEVDNGRVQKFAPKAGANPDFLVAKPIYSARK